jgi:RNA-binding protein NOB1
MGKLQGLVLDAGPLLTQTYNDIQLLADKFYTTPSVHAEIKDVKARQNLLLWGDNLILRQPKPGSVIAASEFAKKTGDYGVLSSTDLQIIALCYELDIEMHNGDSSHLRKHPKPVVTGGAVKTNYGGKQLDKQQTVESIAQNVEDITLVENNDTEDDGFTVVTKPKKGKKRYRNKQQRPNPLVDKKAADSNHQTGEPRNTESTEQAPSTSESTETSAGETARDVETSQQTSGTNESEQEHSVEDDWDSDDDEGWITSENVQSLLINDGGAAQDQTPDEDVKVALSTGDFAAQNVGLQMGLRLVNPTNGRQIRSVKNYMMRCHGCFKLCGLPKDGRPRHFCPRCGGDTLLRCTVSVSADGTLEVFLKRNMQWSHRGFKYALPNSQGKNARRTQRNTGQLLLREDQPEYEKAVKDSMWRQRQHDKMLDQWVGEGSAESVMSPFAISGYNRDAVRHSGVRVGKGRYVNTARKG